MEGTGPSFSLAGCYSVPSVWRGLVHLSPLLGVIVFRVYERSHSCLSTQVEPYLEKTKQSVWFES